MLGLLPLVVKPGFGCPVPVPIEPGLKPDTVLVPAPPLEVLAIRLHSPSVAVLCMVWVWDIRVSISANCPNSFLVLSQGDKSIDILVSHLFLCLFGVISNPPVVKNPPWVSFHSYLCSWYSCCSSGVRVLMSLVGNSGSNDICLARL